MGGLTTFGFEQWPALVRCLGQGARSTRNSVLIRTGFLTLTAATGTVVVLVAQSPPALRPAGPGRHRRRRLRARYSYWRRHSSVGDSAAKKTGRCGNCSRKMPLLQRRAASRYRRSNAFATANGARPAEN
jgi:hypothetical protein